MRPSLRFEVFKRDRFTCAYCGAHPPNVLLHVDHVVPVAAGGTDDITNLLTSCDKCNLGKGARLVEETSVPVPDLAALRERLDQAREYQNLVLEREELLAKAHDCVLDRWTSQMGGERKEGGWTCQLGFPDEKSLDYFLRELPLEHLLKAVEITGRKLEAEDYSFRRCVTRYFYGVCHGMIRDLREGR